MRSEEKLNELFKTLREENVTTNISDVSSWINSNKPIANLKSVKKTAIIKKIIIIIAAITTTIIGSILLFTGKQNVNPYKINSASIKENRSIPLVDSSNNKEAIAIKEKIKSTKKQFTSITPITNLTRDSTQHEEIKHSAEAQFTSNIDMNETYPHAEIKKASRYWMSINDTLNIDTLFNGVKSLIFKGDKSDLFVRGSKRSDISMKYNYQLKAKGVFSKKNEGNCELIYELSDSVLTVHLERKGQKFSGVSVISETSKLEFIVPENIDVHMNAALGDINISELKQNTTKLHTSLGDINAENTSGIINLNTDLGDISMKNLEGKINTNTSLGDIVGDNITISDGSNLNSSLGDIKIQLTNPLSECNLKLNTTFGHIKVDRADLKTKAKNKLIIGNGKLKITMTSSLGKIIVR